MKLNWRLVRKISEEAGSVFYISSAKQFNSNYFKLIKAFRNFYPDTNIAYSYKTNYLPKFCSEVKKNGGFAEVVSSMEMQLALKLGVIPEHIFFNGPYKSSQYIEKLLISGGTVNIDSFEEFNLLEQLLPDTGQMFSVGVRCNFDIEDKLISRFGFDEESGDLNSIIRAVSNSKKMQLTGLHCHFASRNLPSWANRTLKMINFMSTLSSEILTKIKYVSLGGGMYGEMDSELKRQFGETTPSFDDYALVSAKAFASYIKNSGLENITLIIEPGTAIVANAVEFLAEVQSVKTVRGQTFVTVNGSSFNLGLSKTKINLPIQALRNSNSLYKGQEVKNAKIVGYTCIEGDVLYDGFSGKIGQGDFLIFSEAGSYSLVMKPPFILPNVPVIELTDDMGGFVYNKSNEQFSDVFQTYLI